MAGTNTAGSSGQLQTSLPTIFSEFYLLEQERGKIINTATREKMPPHTGANFNYINYGQLIALNATDGVDAAQAQSLQDAQTSYTPSEVVVNVVISDRTISRVADPALLGKVGQMAMNAIELKEDQDGCAKFTSFTPTIGSTGTVATIGHLLAAEGILRTGNVAIGGNAEPAPLPWFGILHPNTLASAAVKLIPLSAAVSSVTAVLTSAAADKGVLGAAAVRGIEAGDKGMEVLMGKGLLRQLDLGELMIIADANVGAGTAATDSANGFYSKRGLIYVEEVSPYQRQERDESLRGVEITCVCSYAFGVYRPGAYGVSAMFDGTQPTS